MNLKYVNGIKDHLDRKKNPYLLYEAIALGGLAIRAFGNDYICRTGESVLAFDAALFTLSGRIKDFFYWPK